MKFIRFFFLIVMPLLSNAQTRYEKDFNEFWTDIRDNYAYLQEQHINWDWVKELYAPKARTISNDNEFISFLEQVLNELYNGHSSLNRNLASSNRLVPSGQDMYVEKKNGHFFITDLRKNFGAERAGLKIGMEIISFNGKAIEPQLAHFLPKAIDTTTDEMYQYAIDMLFAGTHDTKRVITVSINGTTRNFYPDSLPLPDDNRLVETRMLNPSTAYIRINNCLYDNKLIDVFDQFVDSVIDKKAIVIDLSETPSGGNTTVARAIIGRFINRTLPYQKHEVDEPMYATKRLWTEYVIPRKKMFKGKVYIVVGHWTGSMGEGIAIGFDATIHPVIVGTRMAGLLGAIDNYRLSETQIGYQFPTEKLYHVNGLPREQFKPTVLTANTLETEQYLQRIR